MIWDIRVKDGYVYAVIQDQAMALAPGEVVVWSGEARYVSEAYRLAWSAGLRFKVVQGSFVPKWSA